jgi:hypothetical protein
MLSHKWREYDALLQNTVPVTPLIWTRRHSLWKLTPDRTVATKAGSGGKKAKDRITLALTKNRGARRLTVVRASVVLTRKVRRIATLREANKTFR